MDRQVGMKILQRQLQLYRIYEKYMFLYDQYNMTKPHVKYDNDMGISGISGISIQNERLLNFI